MNDELARLGVEQALLDTFVHEPAFLIETSTGLSFPELADSFVSREGHTVRAALHYLAARGELLIVHLEFIDGQRIYRQWLELHAVEELTIQRVEPARLIYRNRGITTVHTVSGVQQQGGWRPQEGDYRSFRLEHERIDGTVVRESGLRSTWSETPWVALTGDDVAAGGWLMALEYGARWELNASASEAAFAPVGIAPVVAAGQVWTSPAAWIGVFAGDLDSAAAVMHRFLRETVIPATPGDFPWVQYNTWFSFHCELDETTLLVEADIAAELGVEVFYVDAGWWRGNPRRRDRFSSGLGNWVENRDKFPHGLAWFADQIREKGMHFGIWVEPERVDLRTAHTGTWHEQWIASDRGRYIRCDWPADTDTAWLCYGDARTQEWATAWIGELVESLGVRWLKWDSNYWGVCTNPEHGHGAGDGEAAQIDGVYRVMDALRDRFPDLIIENCAGGATRMDFAIARRTHAAWLNDASEPHYRTRFHTAGASYYYPPEMLNAWVTESEHENVNRQDLPDAVWRAVIRSRMIGAIGFSCQLTTWSDRTRAVAGEEIALYKREIRPLLKTGAVYHLLPQPVIPSRQLLTPDSWEAYQLRSADGTKSVVFGFRNACPAASIVVHPKGLAPDTTYDVAMEDGTTVTATGADLMTTGGIQLATGLLASSVVVITANR